MLRTAFVLVLVIAGTFFSLRGPFHVLLFYLWNAYFRPDTWVWTDTIQRLHLSLVIGGGLVASTLVAGVSLRGERSLLLIGAFFLQSLFSTLFSKHFVTSWPFWFEFSKVFVITYLIVALVDDVKKFRLTILVITLSLGFEGAKQGWAQMILHPGSPNPNPITFLGDNNGVGVGMLMLAPLLLTLAATASSRYEALAHRFLFVGVLYRALSTYSRGTFVAAIFVAIVYWLRSRRKILLLCSAVAIVTPLLLLFQDAYWVRMASIQAPMETEDDSIHGRLHFWNVGIDMGNDNPWLGCGFNAFQECYDRYDTSHGRYGERRAVHSSWFGVFAEQGYPGIVLYVGILLSALLACRRVRRLSRAADPPLELLQYANSLEASLWAFIVGGSFLSFQYNEMAWHIVGLTIALGRIAEASTEIRETEPSESDVPQLASATA